MLSALQQVNKLEINSVHDETFLEYGNVMHDYDFSELIAAADQFTHIPENENVYVAAEPLLEKHTIKSKLEQSVYGEMPIQIGYCNGRNSKLNGLEYHKSSEINVAVTDIVLLLGKVQDIEDNSYNAGNVRAYFIPSGTAVELYATTLHFAPCKVHDEGFKCIVILPEGTNSPLSADRSDKNERIGEDQLLFMRNKWLLAHPERTQLMEKGAYPGIKGENIEISL